MRNTLDRRHLWSRGGAFWIALALAFALLFAGSPALAHKDHKKKQAEAAQVLQQSAQPGATTPTGSKAGPATVAPSPPVVDHGMMGGMDMDMDRSEMPFFQRLFEWIGRLHPFVVHFPIAFFPAALLTAIAGRRRPSFAAPVQFLVVAGGFFAPLAAAAGFIGGMTADPDPILAYHRWLGVAVGIGGVGLGIWAWRRPWEDRGAGMILALTVMTIAIAVQGFLGAAVTHGMDHLMF